MMVRRIAVVAALAFAVPLAVTSPAVAAPQTIFGVQVDVAIQPSGESVLGEVAHIPAAGGGFEVTLGSSLSDNLDIRILSGATEIGSCTIPASSGLTCSSSLNASGLSPGENSVAIAFELSDSNGVIAGVTSSGTLFVVTNVAPTVRVEWRDAAGNWIDGSGVGLPLFEQAAVRCVVTNNSNAPFTFSSFVTTVVFDGGPANVPITGTLAAGETGSYPAWSGLVLLNPSVTCSGSVVLADGTGSGGGNGGGVVPVGGTFSVDPAPQPGTTVTLTGDSVSPPVVSTLIVRFNGVEVPGSPVSLVDQDGDFSLPIDIPDDLDPGSYAIDVVAEFSGREIVYWQSLFDVDESEAGSGPERELAATGVAATVPLGIAVLVLLLGVAFVVMARRHRSA